MKFITNYIKEGFFGNLGIDTPGDIRHIFDDLSKLSKDYPSIYGFRNPDTATKYGFAFKYYDYYFTLKYNTCQIIIHNGKHKTDKNDMIINMLDFPDLVKNLAKNKVTAVYVFDRNTMGASWYNVQRRTYGPNISIIGFKCEEGKNYRIKYDRAKHIATEMEQYNE